MEKDYVFVDTSVFCKANYFVKDGTISHLFQLQDKGRITLLMPTITKREVQKHYKQDLVEQFDKLSKLHKLKNIESYNLPVMNKDDIYKEVNNKISEMMNHVCELDYSYCQDVEAVFEKYFEKQYPFAGKGKEKEFPDAFALQTIEKYAADNQIKKVIVFEAEKSVLKFASYFGWDKNITVGCNGSNISRYHLQQVLDAGAEEMIIALDRQFQEIGDEEYIHLMLNLQKMSEKYKNDIKVSIIFDKDMLTNYKDSPIDDGPELFQKLYNERTQLY